MGQEAKEALQQYFSVAKKLDQLGIIQSRDNTGDIGKHLCKVMYNLELPKRG